MSITVKEGSLLLDMNEVLPVIKEHHDKYQHKDSLPIFDLDIDTLLHLEANSLFFSSKLSIEGKLEGFISSIISPNLHYKDFRFAHANVIYINPKLGNKRIGYLKRLIGHHENLAKKYMVDYLNIGCSPIKDISPLLEKLGYFKTEIVQTKRI